MEDENKNFQNVVLVQNPQCMSLNTFVSGYHVITEIYSVEKY